MSKIEEDVFIDNKDDPISKFKLKFFKVKYMQIQLLGSKIKTLIICNHILTKQTGSYLKSEDMDFCIEKTNFTEDQIIDWFKRFRIDCPNGRLTMEQLMDLFKKAFPEGIFSHL